MKAIRIKTFEYLSQLGFSLSLLCAIHCLAMPFVVAFAPLMGSFMSHTLEIYILIASVIIASYVLFNSYRQHQNSWPLILFIISVFASFLGMVVFHASFELPLMVTSGISMASAYYVNWKVQKSCKLIPSNQN